VVGGACFAATGALSFTSSTVHASQALAHAATLKSGGILGVDPGLARAADNEVTHARFSKGLALVTAVPGAQLLGRGAVAAREVSREAAREALLIANTEKTIAEASEQVSKGARAVLPDSARILPGKLLEDTLGVSNGGTRAATTISEASAPLANVEAKLTLVGGKPVVIGSEVNPGTAGMAMLGELDGKPVVLYTRSMAGQFGPMGASARMVQMSNGQVQESAQGARILSEMGIGPKFHGVVELEEQIAGTTVKRAYSVVDPVPGDFPAKMGAAINKQTYKDLETVISRVSNRAGEITDLQYLVGKNGRISVIDPEPGILAGAGATNKSPDLLSQATRFRANLIDETANQAVSTQYLRELRIQDRSAYESVVQSLQHSAARTDSAEQLIRANKLKKILSGL
jgi:hypothetical protein